MSLNLQIKPRRNNRRFRRIFMLAGIALLLTLLVAVQRAGEPGQLLADVGREILAPLPITIPQLESEVAQAQPEQTQTDSVVLVESEIIENPQSSAFTADLYDATGKDPIPWPHVDDRANVETYIVQSGDSLWGISAQFSLDIDTLRWSNPELERNPDVLSVGAELRIMPVPGVYHEADAGETVDTIAAIYGVAPTDISDYPPNALFPPYELEAGQGVVVPYGRKDVVKLPAPSLAPASELAWPLVGGITQGFHSDHLALDIGAPYGSIVFAADDGTITYADWATTGYGYTVIIDHGDGRETWYNHLKGALLGSGGFVTRGTPIGEVGSTGHSTGPHVHLELRLNGEQVNPIEYLPGTTPQ